MKKLPRASRWPWRPADDRRQRGVGQTPRGCQSVQARAHEVEEEDGLGFVGGALFCLAVLACDVVGKYLGSKLLST